MHRPHDVKMFSASDQANSVSMGNPFLKAHFTAAGQTLAAVPAKQPLLGGIPVLATANTIAGSW